MKQITSAIIQNELDECDSSYELEKVLKKYPNRIYTQLIFFVDNNKFVPMNFFSLDNNFNIKIES